MKVLFSFVILFLLAKPLSAQVFDLDTIKFNGSIMKRINIVILAEGYQASEISKFIADATKISSDLFKKMPFKQYQKYFNVFALKVVSNSSGTDHPGTATDVTEPATPIVNANTYFDATLDFGSIHRLLVPQQLSHSIFTVLADNFPLYDIVMVLVNSPVYGGSGGIFATVSAHPLASEIAIHELGHSFGSLADEYWAGNVGERANRTTNTNPNNIIWKNWLNTGGVGIYPIDANGQGAKWYRPHQSCIMRALANPFCPVCTESIIEKIHDAQFPVDMLFPDSGPIFITNNDPLKFKVKLIPIEPNTVDINWFVQSQPFAQHIDSIVLDPTPFINKFQVTATVEDTSMLLRVNNHDRLHLYTYEWVIKKNFSNVVIEQPLENEVRIQVYPNPSNDWITVNCSALKATEMKLELYTENGQLCNIFERNITPGIENDLQFRLPDVKGVIWAKITLNGRVWTQKLVRN